MRSRLVLIGAACAVLAPLVCQAKAQDPYNLAWVRQLGTSSYDYNTGIAVDATGNIFISGNTQGSLDGSNAGGLDAFLAKYDSFGNILWARQLGTSADDAANGIAVDGDGNVFIGGETYGNLGGPNAGGQDAFVAKYDTSGSLLWTRQLGSSASDYGRRVGVDGEGNVFISGITEGDLGGPHSGSLIIYISKYDSFGNILWTHQTNQWINDMVVDITGSIFIAGGGSVSKFDASGNILWTSTEGIGSYDETRNVAVDMSGDVLITGNHWIGDYWWDSKYDASGNILWTGRLDKAGWGDLAVDANEDAFVVADYLSKYNKWGNLLWTQALGCAGSSVAVDTDGNVFISGGGGDIFLAKYDAPEPATIGLLLIGAGFFTHRRRMGR